LEPSAGRASPETPAGHAHAPSAAGPAGVPAVVEWTVSPWRESRTGALLAVAGALALWVLVIRMLPGEPLVASLLGIAVLAVLAPGMATTHCRVDGEGVARRLLLGWDRRRWDDIRRARVGPSGLHVSPLAAPGRLDRFRGLFLPVPGASAARERILEALRREVVRHGL